MKLEFESIECDGFGGLLDLDVDGDLALVCPWFAGLEVEEGDGVVGRLNAGDLLAICTRHSTVYSLLAWKDIPIRRHLDQRA